MLAPFWWFACHPLINFTKFTFRYSYCYFSGYWLLPNNLLCVLFSILLDFFAISVFNYKLQLSLILVDSDDPTQIAWNCRFSRISLLLSYFDEAFVPLGTFRSFWGIFIEFSSFSFCCRCCPMLFSNPRPCETNEPNNPIRQQMNVFHVDFHSHSHFHFHFVFPLKHHQRNVKKATATT